MELRHPGLYIQQELTKRGRTQKGFANILGKKVSEVNELIKGKRNITIQRDILLATIFDTDPKKWITLQMEYDYQEGNKSINIEKLKEIKTRRNLLEEKEGNISAARPEIKDEKLKTQDTEDEIVQNPVALDKKSSTIQDTETLPKYQTIQNNPGQFGGKKDKKKEHEIFRNF